MKNPEAYPAEQRIVSAIQKLIKRLDKGVKIEQPSLDARRLVEIFYANQGSRFCTRIVSADPDADGAVMKALLKNYGFDEAAKIASWAGGPGEVMKLDAVPHHVARYYESIRRAFLDVPQNRKAVEHVDALLKRASTPSSYSGKLVMRDGHEGKMLDPGERKLLRGYFVKIGFEWFPMETRKLIENRPELEASDEYVRFNDE